MNIAAVASTQLSQLVRLFTTCVFSKHANKLFEGSLRGENSVNSLLTSLLHPTLQPYDIQRQNAVFHVHAADVVIVTNYISYSKV